MKLNIKVKDFKNYHRKKNIKFYITRKNVMITEEQRIYLSFYQQKKIALSLSQQKKAKQEEDILLQG